VYVVQTGKTAKIQTVTIALTTANSVGLSAGLNAGEVVVVDGQDKLQDGSQVNPSTAPAAAPNAQSTNAGQQPSPQQGKTQSGARRTDTPQQGHAAGKAQ